MASLRVFAPNAAFVEGLPEASRAALGRWANSKTADVYVRDHAKVVNGIWDRLITAYQDQSSKVVGPTQVNFNIHGSEYFMGGEPCDRLVAAMAKRRRTDADNKRNFLDTDTEDWGPLRLIANLKRAVSKAHLVDVYGTCIGCGWKPRTDAVDWYPTATSWNSARSKISKLCQKCFENFGLPEEFETVSASAADGTESDDSESSASSSSSSSASESGGPFH